MPRTRLRRSVLPALVALVMLMPRPSARRPGRDDVFALLLNGAPAAAGFLEGGNIQLHTCK